MPCTRPRVQVDKKCLKPGYIAKGKLKRHQVPMGTDEEGRPLIMELVSPALAMAALFFHPCNFPHQHMRAEMEFGKEEHVDAWLEKQEFRARAVDLGITTASGLMRLAGSAKGAAQLRASAPAEGDAILKLLQDPECDLLPGLPRVYGHPFSCDKAIAAQKVVDAKPQEEDEIHVLLQHQAASDKTDVSAVETQWPRHLKGTNIEASHWFKRESKIWLSSMASLPWDPLLKAEAMAQARHNLYQKQLALELVCMEDLARHGIRCTYKSPPLHPPRPPIPSPSPTPPPSPSPHPPPSPIFLVNAGRMDGKASAECP